MPIPPSTDNYTIPAGQKIYFNDGSGEKLLGNIAGLDLQHTIETLEHWSNMSGDRKLDKIVPVSRKLEFNFTLDEPVIENLQRYFAGGDIENVGVGTGSKTDQKLTLTGTILHSVGQYYGLTAVTVRQFLDKCFIYDGAAYTDKSVEADSLAGTPFVLLADALDFAYFGKNTKFKEIYLDLETLGNYTGVAWEYWDGAVWQTLVTAGAGDGLDSDGKVNWTVPGDWAKKNVNDSSLYWVRVKCTTCVIPATCNCVRQNAVANTDYILDPGQAGQSGRIDGKIGRLSGGFLVDGEEIMVNFTYVTWTSQKFPLSTQGYIEGSARVEIFPTEGLGIQKEYVIPKCQIRPNGNIKEDDKTWEEIPMTLAVLSDYLNNPTAPYGHLVVYE
jgi:hypothetical protein